MRELSEVDIRAMDEEFEAFESREGSQAFRDFVVDFLNDLLAVLSEQRKESRELRSALEDAGLL